MGLLKISKQKCESPTTLLQPNSLLVRVFYNCCNKLPHVQWIQKNTNYYLAIHFDIYWTNQGVSRDAFLSEDSREEFLTLPVPISRGCPHTLSPGSLPSSSKAATLQLSNHYSAVTSPSDQSHESCLLLRIQVIRLCLPG